MGKKQQFDGNRAITIDGHQFIGLRDAKNISLLFTKIIEHEKTALKLIIQTARVYYDAGNILAAAIRKWPVNKIRLTAKDISDVTGFPERKITIAIKIFRHFENNPEALDSLTLRDSLKLIAPPPPAGEDGYNRIDLGGDPGQMHLDFGDLFDVPAAANQSLQNYRTIGESISEIIVIKRTNDGGIISKRFAHFAEDIPQNTNLRHAYKIMSQKTQAAIEDYLVALEQEEVHS